MLRFGLGRPTNEMKQLIKSRPSNNLRCHIDNCQKLKSMNQEDEGKDFEGANTKHLPQLSCQRANVPLTVTNKIASEKLYNTIIASQDR